MNELMTSEGDGLPSTLLQDDIRRTVERMSHATAESTRRSYAMAWQRFTAWCASRNVDPLPSHPQLIAMHLNALAEDHGLSVSSIEIARAAILSANAEAGLPVDDADSSIDRVMKAIRRDFGKSQRRAAALLIDDLKAMLATDDHDDVAHIRDKALLALGFGHALRGASELLQLDYDRPGDGRGHVEMTRDGVVIHLKNSKTSDKPEVLTVESPIIRAAVARWIAVAGIRSGEPLFRRIRKGGQVTADRLGDDGLMKIIRARLAALRLAQGRTADEAEVESRRFSTHSLRRGAATSMANAGTDMLGIQQITRHKTMQMVRRYVDESGQHYAPMKALGL